jgi:Tol biopolymer transport system component
MRRRGFLVAALLGSLFATSSLAGKPGGGGGGTGGGTIYFTYFDALRSMNSDGSGKAPAGVEGRPSRALHGGQRWFLQTQDIAGQTYPSGATRRELFAVRGDGAVTVQLTDQAALEMPALVAPRYSITADWTPGDAEVSFLGRRWAGGAVTEVGVYVAALLFDGGGGVSGLAVQPATPLVPMATVTPGFDGEEGPDAFTFDWSPDRAHLVYWKRSSSDLWVADVGGGHRLLAAGAFPSWSPAGTAIAYVSGGIWAIAPDGTNAREIVKSLSKAGRRSNPDRPMWSPTGSHLCYELFEDAATTPDRRDVYRVAADGSGKANLTGELPMDGDFRPAGAQPVAWR